jgi:hypothetical protein
MSKISGAYEQSTLAPRFGFYLDPVIPRHSRCSQLHYGCAWSSQPNRSATISEDLEPSLTPIVDVDLGKIDFVKEIKGQIALLREECEKVGRKFDGFDITSSVAPNLTLSSVWSTSASRTCPQAWPLPTAPAL